jgi:uncharacterized protein (DUF1330 family)
MPAYWIGMIDVKDAAKFKGYSDLAPAAIKKFGGKMLSRAGQLSVLEGESPKPRVAIIEFENVEKARACYFSPEYQEAKQKREGAAVAQFFIVEG